MNHPVTHGNDPEKLRSISDALLREGKSLASIGGNGAAMLAVLEDSWSGSDVEIFTSSWGTVRQQTETAADRLTTYARAAREQADEQEAASGGGGGGRATPTPTDPFAGLKVSGTARSTGGFSLPDLPSWGDVKDATKGLANGAANLWDKGVNKLDELTDKANEWWKDNVEDTWLARQAQLRLSQGAALLNDFAEYAYNTDCPFMPVLGFASEMLSDTLDSTSRYINDPKGALLDDWNGSGWLGRTAMIASVIPLGRLLKKPADKADDLGRKILKKDPPGWKDDFADKAAKKDSSNPQEAAQARLNDRADRYVDRYGLKQPEDVWDTNKIDPRRRGIVVEAAHGGNLPGSYKTWDKLEETADGRQVATSIKSIDPDAASYGKNGAVESRLKSYVDDIDGATPQNRGGVSIDPDDLDGKQLEVVTPPGGFSAGQLEELHRVRQYADSKGVDIVVKEYP